jgi:hypothetical protein
MKVDDMGTACSTHGRNKKCGILIGKPERKGHDREVRACKQGNVNSVSIKSKKFD